MSATAGSGVEVVAIDTPTLGDRSYLAHDGSVALVVDPQRDIDRVLALAAARGVRITHVFETHLHNDYVTGGLALARLTGAAYHVSAADPVAFDRVPVSDGEVIEVSPVMSVRVLATPGHTFTPHVVRAGRPRGSRMRCSPAGRCCTARPGGRTCSARRMPASLPAPSTARRAGWPAELPDDADVYPTHGFGSFCSATQTEGTSSTIGREQAVNPALILDEDSYVARDCWPAWTPTRPTTRTWARPTLPGRRART